jgi:signal transduction histidine kinase
VRYGQAKNIWISLESSLEQVQLKIRDDGSGQEAYKSNKEISIRMMKRMASQIGADLHVDTTPDGSVLVTCTLPAEKMDKAA